MTRPLRLGLAGLGTVGTGVLDALQRHGKSMALRAGRPVIVVGVSARQRGKSRGGHNLDKIDWVEDPVTLASSPDIDVFVELIGGEGDPAETAVEAALKSGKPSSPPTRRSSPIMAHASPGSPMITGVALYFEAAVAGGIPIVKTMRESLAGNRCQAHLRHPQRHLQLHPDQDDP